jgi:multidrug efflux pump subunit AcrA (membrane-fusion protein)
MTTEGNRQSAPGDSHEAAPRKSRLFLVLVGIVIVLVIIGTFTMLQHREQYNALAKETEKLAVPTVAVIHPTLEPGQEDLVLPSTLQAFTESPIYARTTGYLKKWYHDIGSHVQQGELLADIETPEVDQQLYQARADLGTTQANENLSRITA